MRNDYELSLVRIDYAKRATIEILETLAQIELLYEISSEAAIKKSYVEEEINYRISVIRNNIPIILMLRKDVSPREDEIMANIIKVIDNTKIKEENDLS